MKTTLSHTPCFGFRSAVLIVAVFLSAALSPIFAAPPEVTIKARFVQIQPGSGWPEKTDWYLKAVEASPDQTFSATLTDSQFKEMLNTLKQRHGADLLNEGQVTTLSGRQAQLSVVLDLQELQKELANSDSNGLYSSNSRLMAKSTNWMGAILDVFP